jgi:Ni,Fe-hydrogenase III small subunit/formate hydrogenlyase subunit 6/NADH:ubiquinone oxidoreductase subunit I
MLDLLRYVIGEGKATQKKLFPPLDAAARGLPRIDQDKPCQGTECGACAAVCPTNAIKIANGKDNGQVILDLGSCIGCGLCVDICPTGLFVNNPSTQTAATSREAMHLTNHSQAAAAPLAPVTGKAAAIFRQSLAVRVVSTGCASCDMEVSAAGNPIFDMDRFGISVVAGPRQADALLVTGPVGSSMQDAVKHVYEAMAEPRLVIACGTCAISGGVHKGGYADANGLSALLPVDVYIPGCPPHPWSIIDGLMTAMGRRHKPTP